MALPTDKFLILTNLGAEKLTRWAFVVGCMAVVLWIRTMPLSIPAADDLAERIVARKVREQIAPQVMRQVPGEKWQDYVEDAAREWIKRHQAEYDAARASVAAQVKSDFSFKAENGRRYAHLGDYDSYVWLRNARNYLRRGTTCDAIVDGECRDTYGNAPVGYRMMYNRSLHTAAIVAVHRAITFFDPNYPLSASSFLVPVFLGTLGVLPAFFIGRRVGGNLGGVFAALIISLYPAFLLRSIGSDNDVWNVVLPLFAAWAMVAALDARKIFPAAISAVLAGGLTGMHAAVWRGWLFTYGVLLCAALGHWLLCAVREAAARGTTRRLWRADEIRKVACVVLAYYVSVGVFTWLAGESAFSVPFRMLASVVGLAGQKSGGAESLWPQALGTVSELSRPKPGDIVQFMGGGFFFFGGWLGLIALVLPKGDWRPRHFALVIWTAALYVASYYFFAWRDVPRSVLVFLFALPLAAELLARSLKKNASQDVTPKDVSPKNMSHGSVTLVIVWFFVALYMVSGGIRFLILFGVPFGFAFGAVAGRGREWLEKLLQRAPLLHFARPGAASLAIALAVLVYPVWRGYATVKSYYPAMNRAWWDSLIKIRNESRPDAIVNAWWDYGYWIKYAAERRVSSDGGSLQTHVPYWLAQALVAPTETESRGILRMLNCGSDATPSPEGAQGAFGRLKAMGADDVTANSILMEVVKLDKTRAGQYLAQRGFTAPEQNNLLAATHCAPPESFLVVSKEMILKGEWWMGLGSWDVTRAYVITRTRRLPEGQAVADWTRRFGYSADEALALYRRVAAMKSAAEAEAFIAPVQRLIPTEWIPCRNVGGGPEMSCRITLTHAGETSYMYFVYHPAAPKGGRLRNGPRKGPPAVVIVAGAERLEEIADPSPAFADVGVLIDPARERILVGTPLLIRSTLLRLLYLDPRYLKRYALFDRRSTAAGEEVATWKIDWESD
jgi:dolichyl-diphosphooligosaccharide--protein glycosyltransferase